jgi:hypothetical protein
MLFLYFHIPVLSVRMGEQQPLTYQQMLAEIYEENAANQYVVERFYENEDVDGFDVDKYSELEIEDRDEFNKFQGDRNKPDNVVKPPPSTNEQGKASYAYNKDIRTTVVNIDGRFRAVSSQTNERPSRSQCAAEAAIQENFGQSSGTQFAIMLGKQYKNVTSIKVTSLEFENSFYTFTALDPITDLGRDNTSFKIKLDNDIGATGATGATVTIPDGNYDVPLLSSTIISNTLSAIQSVYGYTGTTGYTGNTGYFYFGIDQNPRTLKLTITSNHEFGIDFPSTTSSFTKNGIGYNLGFYDLNDNLSTMTPPYTLLADTRPDVKQDQYIYLRINDWYQVHHQYPDQTKLSAFLKIPITVPKFTVQYDNVQLDTVTKEYFFSQPTNVHKLVISVIDSYGALLDMQGGSFSMSLAIDEILQANIYEKMLQI